MKRRAERRDTEHKLRSYVESQPDQEGLCIALLPHLGKYSAPKSRRPHGGPDGGHDIEAIYDGNMTVFGAVAFKHHATDSPADKRSIKKKFRDDLAAALAAKPDLRGFVFFTNIDLRPGEIEQLVQRAKKAGVQH